MEMALKRSDTRYLMAFYLFPLVCEEKKDFELILHSRFVGVYIGDTNKPNWENKLLVVFKDLAPKQFKDFFDRNQWAYKTYYDTIDNNNYAIYAFHIPFKFKTDVEHILKNEFTKVSSPFITKIDWISFPKDSSDLFHGYNRLHGKLKRINPDEIQLDLNQVNKKGSNKLTPFSVCIF